MITRKQKHTLLKFFSMFSVIRGYNILVLVLAQYLTAIYILANHLPVKEVLLDVNLFLLVLATVATIAAGYIINNFYDSEKDLINRPQKSMLDRLISQNTKLSFYFVLNFMAVVCASYVSFKSVVFFSGYIFAIWFYSHKLKKMPFIGNIVSSVLTITPFFIVFVYYKNFEPVIFVHALYLFLLVSMRELIKDLENIKGDLTFNYKTIPVVYGEKTAKYMLSVLMLLSVIPAAVLLFYFDIGKMNYYFYLSTFLLAVFVGFLWKSGDKKHYVILHNLLKLIIVLGVLCITLIEPNLIIDKLGVCL